MNAPRKTDGISRLSFLYLDIRRFDSPDVTGCLQAIDTFLIKYISMFNVIKTMIVR